MSIWIGLNKAGGAQHKVGLIKTLEDKGGDISSLIVNGIGDSGGLPAGNFVKVTSLAQVDYAILQMASGSGTINGSGGFTVAPIVLGYFSGNAFSFMLVTRISGGDATGSLSHFNISGDNLSGVYPIKALIIGEAKRAITG